MIGVGCIGFLGGRDNCSDDVPPTRRDLTTTQKLTTILQQYYSLLCISLHPITV